MVLIALVAGIGIVACADRTYLTKSHGRAYSEAFGRQTVNPDPPPRAHHADATQGLDSQEAAAVAGSYRRSLSGKEGTAEGMQPTLIMTPGAGQPTPYMPPPSVPSGQ
jgi:hypothetical protein